MAGVDMNMVPPLSLLGPIFLGGHMQQLSPLSVYLLSVGVGIGGTITVVWLVWLR